MNKTEFEILIDKCKNNDTKSQSIIYTMFYDAVYYTCLKKFQRDSNISKDMTQDIFIKTFKNINKFQGTEPNQFGAWIIKITKNFILDHFKIKKPSICEYVCLSCVEIEDEIEEITDQLYTNEVIKESIKKLPKQQKNAIDLYFFQKLSHDEISKRLNIGIGTSKSNLFKAKNKIKNILTT